MTRYRQLPDSALPDGWGYGEAKGMHCTYFKHFRHQHKGLASITLVDHVWQVSFMFSEDFSIAPELMRESFPDPVTAAVYMELIYG